MTEPRSRLGMRPSVLSAVFPEVLALEGRLSLLVFARFSPILPVFAASIPVFGGRGHAFAAYERGLDADLHDFAVRFATNEADESLDGERSHPRLRHCHGGERRIGEQAR